MTQTEVVPSPASTSWALDNSTNWKKTQTFQVTAAKHSMEQN